jgi:hypothetical protein
MANEGCPSSNPTPIVTDDQVRLIALGIAKREVGALRSQIQQQAAQPASGLDAAAILAAQYFT